MLTKKSFGIAFAAALALGASGAALATPVNVDGVTWDTSSPFNLTINSFNLRESQVTKTGDVLYGYGQIGSINGNNSFCISCDLTFTFSYTVQSVTGNQIVFNGGSFQFYVGAAGSFNAAIPASATSGTPWVTLMGHTSKNATFTDDIGQLFGTIVGTVSNPLAGSNGFGLVDATSGDAMPYLDIYKVADGLGGFANLSLNSEFQFKPARGCESVTTNLDNLCTYPIEGNGSLIGRTATPVPEPGEVGLLGLGLGVLGFFMWRRRKETDERK